MLARKFIEKKVEGEYEMIRNHVVDVTEQVAINEIVECFDLYDEDGDTAYFDYGLCFDLDGDVHHIDVNKFISGITVLLNVQVDDDYGFLGEEKVDLFRAELKKLEKYRGYDIFV